MQEITESYREIKKDPAFLDELHSLWKHYVGRPSPVFLAKNLSAELGGAQIYFKREDLNHTGAHKINHCIGEALLAKKMGKKKLIAETGAGQHGVALATAAVASATPCCPAPVSAMSFFFPIFFASNASPIQWLILCAPVWLRSSRLK